MEPMTNRSAISEVQGGDERRGHRRVKVERKALVRPSNPSYQEVVEVSVNSSRRGLYFSTSARHYHMGMGLRIVLGYAPNDPCNTSAYCEVVRIEKLPDGKLGIGVRILLV